MAHPWPRSLHHWYRRSPYAERATVAARRLSADLTAVMARSGITDARRAVVGPTGSRAGPPPDGPVAIAPMLVFPARSDAAHPGDAPTDSDEAAGPAVAPVDAGGIGAGVGAPPPADIPLLPRPDASDDPLQGGTATGPGRWLPLRDALREIGSLEHLYRLARDGELQSREEAAGRVEVWVADRDCFGATPSRCLEPTQPSESVGSGGSHCSEAEHQVLALTAALVENHERHLELARENGALGERVAQLERQLGEFTGRPTRLWGPRG